MAEPLTDAELGAIKARADAATPGPWVWLEETDDLHATAVIDPDDSWAGQWGQPIVITDSGVYPPHGRDRDFIAAAREDLPRLLDEVARLRELLLPLIAHDPFPSDNWGERVDCAYCTGHGYGEVAHHTPDCPWKVARDALGVGIAVHSANS